MKVVGLLVSFFIAGQALADTISARQLLERGIALFSDGSFARSREVLDRARVQTDDSGLLGQIHLYLGLNHAAENQPQKARAAFSTALTNDPQLFMDPERHKPMFVDLFEQVRSTMVGELVVTVDQHSATVAIDGISVGLAPYSGILLRGKHTVEILGTKGAGYRRREVNVLAGQTTRLVLMPEGRMPISEQKLPPTAEQQLEQEDRSPRRLWTWIATVGAVAAAGTALGLTLSAKGDYDEGCSLLAERNLPCGERTLLDRAADRQHYEELQDSVNTKQLAANILWGTTGAMAAAAVILFFLEERWGRTEASRSAGVLRTVRAVPGGFLVAF